MLGYCGSRLPKLSAPSGGICETGILQAASFVTSIRWTLTSSISIVRHVLDFYCAAANLAIELDGGGHNYRVDQTRDRRRSELLARRGIAVLRFWNHQIRRELDNVLEAIWFALQERHQNKPSP
jgi:very-short-patch-repair endonuclease